jgi:hypothetical protein
MTDPVVLRPPTVTQDGYLSREAFYDFFRQLYPNPNGLNNHVGKLLSAIIRSTQTEITEPIKFEVLCGRCRRLLSEDCDVTKLPHKRYDSAWSYLIGVESLKAHADEFMDRPKRYIGPSVKGDLLRLRDQL